MSELPPGGVRGGRGLRRTLLLLAWSLAAAEAVSSGEDPSDRPFGIGRPATPALIAERDLTVFPDGAGLPRGSGTAELGRLVYERQCAACHGLRGEGQGGYPPVAHGGGNPETGDPVPTVGTYWPEATTVWDYVRRAMPYYTPGTLSTDEVYGLTAYLLYLDGVVGEHDLLSETTLPRVRMPNREGFVPDPR